jgi:hypothetical protein
LKPHGARLIANSERKQQPFGELRDFVCAPSKNGAVAAVVRFQRVEKIRGSDTAVDAKAWAARDAALADEEYAAVLIFNLGIVFFGMLGFLLCLGAGGEKHEGSGEGNATNS